MAQTSAARPSTEKPFFRYDLETTALQEAGNRYVDISDPDSGTSFRLYEVEYAVACGMDGQRDLSALVAWAKQELDLDTSAGELRSIVSKLGELKYLGTPEGGIEVEDATAATAAPADVELGTPGKSPIAKEVAAAPIAAKVALGTAGRGLASGPKLSSAVLDMELGDAGGTSDMDSDQVTELGKPSKLLEDFNEGLAAAAEAKAMEKEAAALAAKAAEEKAAAEVKAAEEKAAAEVKAAEEKAAAEVKEEKAAAEAKAAEEKAAAEVKAAEEKAAKSAPVPTPPPVPGSAKDEPDVTDISAAIATDAKEAKADKAVSLPEKEKTAKSPKVTRAAKPQVAPEPASSNRLLFGLLIVVAIAAAAYYYFVEQNAETSGSSSPKTVEVAPVVKSAPPAPEAVLKVFEASAIEALATQEGVVAWVAPAGTEIAEGGELVKLGGTERLTRDLERDETALAAYQAKLETLKEKGPAQRLAAAEGNLERKNADIEVIKKKLAAFVIAAPTAGVVEPLVEVGARVLVEQAVAKVTGLGRTSATFTLPESSSVSVGDELTVVAQDDAELKATCKVTKVASQTATIECPPDKGFAPDSGVKLLLAE